MLQNNKEHGQEQSKGEGEDEDEKAEKEEMEEEIKELKELIEEKDNEIADYALKFDEMLNSNRNYENKIRSLTMKVKQLSKSGDTTQNIENLTNSIRPKKVATRTPLGLIKSPRGSSQAE